MEKILTIAIPTYNRCAFLDKTLKHIERQYDDRLEIIVSDNASDDATYDIVKSYQKKYNINYSRNEYNIGGDANFLKCLKLAKGKFNSNRRGSCL